MGDFQNSDLHVKHKVDSCIACQANSGTSRPDYLKMSLLPPESWHTVHIDFCGPFPSDEHLFVVIDAYCHYPEVEIVHSTSAATIIPKMDKIFATHGIPSVVESDNGHAQKSMEENGIQNCRITPLWPQANSEAENFMKLMTKAIRLARVEGQAWKKHLHKFLLNSPHCTTKFSPAKLLFNRKIKNKLPHISSNNKPIADDLVLVRQRKQNKFSTPYNPSPFRVVRKKGFMITAQLNGKYITRNAYHFKVLHPELQEITVEGEGLHKEH